MPLGIRVAALLGIVIPVGMLAQLGHEEKQVLEGEVGDLSAENMVLIVEKKALVVEKKALVVEKEALAFENGTLAVEKEELVSENRALASERDAFAALSGEVDSLRVRLADSNKLLEIGRAERELLKHRVAGLSDRVGVLVEREESLHGIIDLLEGEVASSERRLEELAKNQSSELRDFRPLSAAAIVAANDPQVRLENDRLRNELSKHDEQVVELLGEIGVLNQELEVMRDERSRLGDQAQELSREAQEQRDAIDASVGNGGLAGLPEED